MLDIEALHQIRIKKEMVKKIESREITHARNISYIISSGLLKLFKFETTV